MSSIWKITSVRRIVKDNKVTHKTSIEEIEVPTRVQEISLKKWVDFMLIKESAPKWFKDVEAADHDLRNQLLSEWDESHWSEFYMLSAQLINSVIDADLMSLLNLQLVDHAEKAKAGQSLITIYLQINSMIVGYKPKRREMFAWKGSEYYFPIDLIDTLERKYTGGQLTTLEAIEALQIEHVYNVKDSNTGEHVMRDRKYHTDIALLAVLSRKKLRNDELEQIPLDFADRRRWIARRVKLFGDVPMDIALDMSFFLLNSKVILKRILQLHTSLIESSKTSVMHNKQKSS